MPENEGKMSLKDEKRKGGRFRNSPFKKNRPQKHQHGVSTGKGNIFETGS